MSAVAGCLAANKFSVKKRGAVAGPPDSLAKKIPDTF